MTKFIPYAVIALLVLGTAVMISGKLKNQSPEESTDTQQIEEAMMDATPSIMPVSEIKLDTKASIDKAIDAELDQMDQELKGSNANDFDASGLSDSQLGL